MMMMMMIIIIIIIIIGKVTMPTHCTAKGYRLVEVKLHAS